MAASPRTAVSHVQELQVILKGLGFRFRVWGAAHNQWILNANDVTGDSFEGVRLHNKVANKTEARPCP